MRSLERHRDVGAYALGVLDEAEAFRFEDHLMECASCTAHVSEFRPAARQLMLYREATPRSVHPAAAPGPRLLERLLDEVAGRHRTGRRRWLVAVAAAVVLAVGGPAAALLADEGSPSHQVTAADTGAGVWARVTAQDREWGSDIGVTVKDASGPHSCRLVAVGRDGSEEVVTSWMVPSAKGEPLAMEGGTALGTGQIARYEIRTDDGTRLLALDAR
ncbi:zf-HC2 domain-containing protein [Streptomyces griseoaurantiacus]|uniref:Putative zinc-finger n=2 Tax=Streptomyces TaxID=1883 RepID=A0A1G7T671_9ACTN|nr:MULTISPECIES: zf-HC2 domain-containing protein [Streptomyces]MCF0100749.1 hypothetical protein [Streptomyces sp. MH191]MDX3092505.1 zf-HC2 domain-containing protein [Streptomyces sp. ME12-02E]MDX3332351.1 zf-HC2 domain-containing protein [Streptomyces sp. ME02-6978a]WTI30024.1 zf-HC2 domain-containing protein [Streptomyces jietaisiensis]SDG30867.1 Putative zinc-finger [Streptomyces jietaisiensis]